VSAYTYSQLTEEIASIRSHLAGSLEGDWRTVLDQALLQARGGEKGVAWAFQIRKDGPLRFRQTDSTETGIPVRVDISGTFVAPQNGRPIFNHSIVIRVWATEIANWFDARRDAPGLKQECIGQGRVVSRLLFDTVNSTREPWFHLHFGGADRQSHEFCSIPEKLLVPRLVHHPMGLIQACELVMFHFYPAVHAKASRDQTWLHSLGQSEKAYARAYFSMIAPLVRSKPRGGSFLLHCRGGT
jgi:hypothetical protein